MIDVSKITLSPISPNGFDIQRFQNYQELEGVLAATIDYYQKIGFNPPWIGYFACVGDIIVGSCGFKGPPSRGKVEIAYGTVAGFEKHGVGTKLCRLLTDMAVAQECDVRITARTLPDNDASAAVLKKNDYQCLGHVEDEDDGDVLEWQYTPAMGSSEKIF